MLALLNRPSRRESSEETVFANHYNSFISRSRWNASCASPFQAILRTRVMEFSWAIASFAGVVLLGTLKGVAVVLFV
jgi:hypothetical protein